MDMSGIKSIDRKRLSRNHSGLNPAAFTRGLLPFFALAIALATVAARADDDLPGRVGRVANVQGALYHAAGEDAGDWAEIGLNYPVAQGDNLWVDHDGRAEVDYGGGQFRVAGDTNLHVSRLDDRQLALFVAAGRVIVRVRVLEPEDSVRVDTPATQISLARPGLYRIDVAADSPQTMLIVREGEAEIATPSGAQQVLPGQSASVSGVANERADLRNSGGIDGFDTWSAARDRVYEQPRENAYVSRQMIGQADLDAYGAWQRFPDYGAVWFPAAVAVDWAPYRYGHWTWLPGFGYTWVDDAPWGYAPFHYGRWAYISGRWGWCPGAYVARPLWAPALVAWYGGAGWNQARYGGPVYGWVPLAWGEPFVPSWGCTSRCWTRYNRPYAVNVAERRNMPPTHYANWAVPGGATAVPGAALASGRPVAVNRVPVGSGAGASAAFAPTILPGPPAVKPLPVRSGAIRPGNRLPPAATGVDTARPRSAPALPGVGRGAAAPSRGLNVVPPSGSVTPAPTRPVDRTTRPVPVVPAPIERPSRPVPVAPAPVERSARPEPVVPAPGQRSFRTAPLPPSPAPQPATRAPAPPMPMPGASPVTAVPRPAPTPLPAPPSRPTVAPPPPAPAGEAGGARPGPPRPPERPS